MKIDLENFDLTQLPDAEDDYFEFKSSSTPHNDIKKKLSCAVSGFANSGGGCFIVGVDGNGNADNGLPLKIGKQDLRDWVDQIVNQVEPVPKYEIKLIDNPMGRGVIQPDSAVLLVAIHESYAAPHMAPDNHYYIRAGAHTVKAKHFIVDAIWAKRHFSKPRLTHLFRLKPEKEQAIQLGVLALTDAPAIEVKINISPLPQMISHCESLFPLQASLIDRNNPFFFDVSTYYQAKELFGEDVYLEVEYYDLAGNPYIYKTKVEISGSVSPITIGNDNPAKMVRALESINKALLQLTVSRENAAKPSFVLPQPSESIFANIENLIPEFLTDMRNDLRDYPCAREFIIMPKGAVYNGDSNNLILQYYFEDHPWLRSKLRILENHALIYEITYNNTPRFVISEELAAYLTKPQAE
jgi:hypothetical protein